MSVNGAAAEWPRNVTPVVLAVVAVVRQWGRGRVAAERLGISLTAAQYVGVNGAAAEWPRNAVQYYVRHG